MKFNKKLIFIIVCIVTFLLIGTISANKLNEINNNNTSSSTIGSFEELQNRINYAPDESVLDLDRDYLHNETGDFTGIKVTKTYLTIDGHGHTIDANSTNNIVRIFNITSGRVTLKNLILKNGNAGNDDGGAILNSGQSLKIYNVTFVNNKAYYGGVIQNYGIQLTINNSNFNDNTASINGGAINNNAIKLSVYNSSFTYNTANDGGAICNDHTNFTLANSSFVNNKANNQGGAIQNQKTGIQINITNSNFTSNTASNYGGAICNDAISFILDNSTFNNNQANNKGGAIQNYGVQITVTNSSFNHNIARIYGGGIQNYGTQLTIINSNFTSNQVSSCGGAINNNANKFSIYNSSFNHNTAFTYGGAICNDGNNFIINNITFNNNIASQKGGAIQNNHTINATIKDSVFNSNHADVYGGAIHSEGSDSDLIIDSSIFIGNNVNDEGGAIYKWKGKEFRVNNSNFTNNQVVSSGTESGGGAIRNYYSDGFSVSNSNFTNNQANNQGGAIDNTGSNNHNITNSTFLGNKVVGKSLSNSVGGAIYNENSYDLTVIDSVFINNEAYYADAIYNEGGSCTANNNWWGTNTPNWNQLTYDSVSHNTYGIVNLTATNKTIELQFYKKGMNYPLFFSRDVTLIIGNQSQSFTGKIVNGSFKMNYMPLIGEYNITALVDNENLSAINVTYNPNDNLTVQNVSMYYHDGTHLVANLTDSQNNSIPNATIHFKINNRTYNRTTNANGIAHMGINLDPGEYQAHVYYNESDDYNFVYSNITVAINTTLIGKDIVKTYQNGTQFYIKVLNPNGTPLNDTNGTPLNNSTVTPLNDSNVKFNINGVFYIRHTNATGVARLTINQEPGNYIVTTYNPVTNEKKGFNITVLPNS